MSRRYVERSKTDSLGNITPEVVAVVSAKDNLETVDAEQQYFKRNYLEAIRKIIPKFYFADEQTISGTHISFPNQLLNSHILANKNQATILPVSGLQYDPYLSGISNPEGFSRYFHTNTSPAQIDTDDFQRNILFPLGRKLSDYTTSEAFVDFVTSSLLPTIPLVCAGHHELDNLADLTASAYATDSSGTYAYLANNLGWLYFLNRTGPAAAGGHTPFDPSSALPLLLTETVWKGRSVALEDSLGVYQEYLWKNQPIWDLEDRVIPIDYVSSMEMSAGTWTSGTQNVERLKTLASIVYSPHFLDSTDNNVEEAFTTYFSTSAPGIDGTLITTEEEAGPLTRFLEAMSFAVADRVTEQAEINTLYDIGKCPEEFLELLGELIGWKFIGGDVDKWRVQLRNAVDIYKMKGTRRSIQYLLDTLFSTGVFNVTTSDTLSELWESYVPDMIYYALATSSPAFDSLDVYTPEQALKFGVPTYSNQSVEVNIKLLVDKIIFDLVREFPNSFYMGGKPFPAPQLLLNGAPYTGPYVIEPNIGVGTQAGAQGGPQYTPPLFPNFWTGYEFTPESQQLELVYDEDFTFYYRDRLYLVPPYEKRQYYTPTRMSANLLERLEYYLICYGVDKSFAKQITDQISSHTVNTLNPDSVLNSFLYFTKEKTYPPNYNDILRDVTKEKTPDPVSLLSLWNGKSSHFLMNFDASTFDFDTQRLVATSKYGLTKVTRVLNQVVPAHAVPMMLLAVSSVDDSLSAIADNDCREWRPNFNALYEGSSTVTTGWATSAVDMAQLADDKGMLPNRFKRGAVDNVNDYLLSGNTFVARGAANRNSLRRRNFHNLLPETKMFTRGGKNNPGSFLLSSAYHSPWGDGYLPLGFIPSSLQFKDIPLESNDIDNIGELLANNIPAVWEICENLSSSSAFFGYDISNTFPSRANQNVATSACSTYGRRGQLPEIISVMTKVNDVNNYLLASSIVSGYFDEFGGTNPNWPTTSEHLNPSTLSTWFNANSDPDLEVWKSIVTKSIGNYLSNKTGGDESLNPYEHFTFGRPVHEMYNSWMTLYNGHGTTNNYDLLGVPNIFSHTYGPLIYNSTMETDGSALEASGYLAASSTVYEVDISYYGGSGVLSPSGMDRLGAYDLGTSCASSSPDLPVGGSEFRNKNLVSSIELVDTSSGLVPITAHPIFSIFRLSRDDQSKYAYNKYLINNQIIKYHRSSDYSRFPRLRITIDPADTTSKAKNFLEPDHVYELTVKAHNLDVIDPDQIGGLSLGCWIHTAPEVKPNGELYPTIRSYDPAGNYDHCGKYNDRWKALGVDNVSGTNGINYVQNNSDSIAFTTGTLDAPDSSGEALGGAAGPITTDVFDVRCYEPQFVETVLKGSNPLSIANVGPKSMQEMKFRFSTKNFGVDTQPPLYVKEIGNTHRLDQKYVIELFVLPNSQISTKMVVFEEISIKDVTNYNKAVIKTEYGEAQLNVQDFKAVCKYFRSLNAGIASRDAVNTSSVMEVSGGSRLNYRSNSAMYGTTTAAATTQLTEVLIDEG